MKRKWLAVGIILLFLGTCIIPATAQNTEKPLPTSRGDWWYVGGSGPVNYTRIQDAINVSSNGDTVFVYDDLSPYYENLMLNKSINLIGEDRDTTVIDAANVGDVVNITAGRVKISSFTIQNSNNSRGTGIRLLSDEITIENNIISNNYDGIYNGYSDYQWPWGYYPQDNNIIKNNIIRNNRMDGIQTGGYNNTILENLITDNNCYGIEISNYLTTYDPTKPQHYVFNNTVFHNGWVEGASGIVLSWGASNNIIESNIVKNNRDYGIGIMAFYSQNQYDRNNTIKNNDIMENHKGILIYECRFNTIAENNISNNTYSILCWNTNAQHNTIFHNNMIHCNDFHAEDIGENTWNHQYPQGGNYWDDYNGTDNFHGPNQDIPGGDGIGDIPYAIRGGYSKDIYPLMDPYGMTTLSFDFKGGLFKWSGIIKNIGNNTAFNVQWKIVNDGGVIFIGRESSGSLLTPLLPGEETQVSSMFILGFGKIIITIAVWADNSPYVSKSTPATLILIFVIVQKP